jgi:hypothetical protein
VVVPESSLLLPQAAVPTASVPASATAAHVFNIPVPQVQLVWS